MAEKSNEMRAEYDVLDVRFNLIDYEREFAIVREWIESGEQHYVTFSNPQNVQECMRNREFRETLSGSGLTLPDGVGIILGARILGYPNSGRVTGPTSMLKICDWGRKHGFRHFLYGGAEGVAEELKRMLTEQLPDLDVVGTHCPPFRSLSDAEKGRIIDDIDASGANIVWVGLGAPKQEFWMREHLGRLRAPVMFGVGAAFDFHSDRVRWAPPLMRKLGLEWLFRLCVEPKRLIRRNFDSPVFLFRVICRRLERAFGNRK